MRPANSAIASLRVLAALAAAAAPILADPAVAAPWQSRTSDQNSVDAIGLAAASDGTPAGRFDGLVLLSVACTDDDGNALRAPSVSFLAYSQAAKRPRDVTATLSVGGRSFTLAGRAYKDTPYYFEVRSVPRGFLQAAAAASSMTAAIKPGDLASTFDMTGAKDVLGTELGKCRR
ncbi:hypothetical protein [Labrys wisconsinensis]|uniref:Uncharacterized protein n=1 Tax=Labrys wisconsinensis TaxID=425677 RepID=A0ABU0J8Y4_9HYPH|nr:hypothetical protein [Labrys wisconsinensis]MDQ0470741.1 hypothetical protein [Labrys wisconsinensis]